MRCFCLAVWLLIVTLLSSCATYTSLPLPTKPDFTAADALTVPVATFDASGVHVTRINLNEPLDASAVSVLAVLNNPALLALRTQHGVAVAQSYAAGLLPWPQVMLGVSHPSPAGVGPQSGWSASVGEDFAALLQHADVEDAAHARETQARLDLVWDEWQVAQQARLLYAAIEDDAAQLKALQPLLRLYAESSRFARRAAAAHSVARTDADALQSVYAMFLAQAATIAADREKNLTALTGLLGLAPRTVLKLALNDHPTPVGAEAVRGALMTLPGRRPDLLAFAAGYRSADAHLRQAILAQFPLMGISLSRERDTEGVISNGLSLTFDLPFLNGSRGKIAVARATRRALHDAYQASLDSAVTEVSALGQEEQGLSSALDRVQHTAQILQVPYDTLLGSVPYKLLAAYEKQRVQTAEQIATLRHRLDETRIALDTLLGLPIGGRLQARTAPT